MRALPVGFAATFSQRSLFLRLDTYSRPTRHRLMSALLIFRSLPDTHIVTVSALLSRCLGSRSTRCFRAIIAVVMKFCGRWRDDSTNPSAAKHQLHIAEDRHLHLHELSLAQRPFRPHRCPYAVAYNGDGAQYDLRREGRMTL